MIAKKRIFCGVMIVILGGMTAGCDIKPLSLANGAIAAFVNAVATMSGNNVGGSIGPQKPDPVSEE